MDCKQDVHDLALLGGRAAFDNELYVGRPNLPGRAAFLKRAGDILDRAWLTNNGTYVQQLEKMLAERTRVKHCIPMANGTIALEVAIRALKLSGEVIVPSFTFIATAHALQWLNITPVFCDVGPRTHNLDPARVEELITPRTTGIIGVHLWGRCCDVEGLTAVARKHGLHLLFDAAHALGCSYQGRPVGGLGEAEVFSFHATKFVNTFEGGALATNNDTLAGVVRLMKNFGFSGYDEVRSVGTNGKMNEFSAAMGVTGLEHFEELIAHNRRNYDAYRRELIDVPGLSLLTYDEDEGGNFQYIVLEVASEAPLSRDDLMRILHGERVIARRYFYPGCHQMEPYRTLYPEAGERLPSTRRLAASVLVLPTGTQIGEEDIERICAVIRFAMTRGVEVSARLRAMERVP